MRPDAPTDAALEPRLAAAVELARAAWPGVGVDAEALVAALAGLPASVAELQEEAIAEVALALACARGDSAALTKLDAIYFAPARRALAAMKLDGGLEEEALQEARAKLLVAEDGPPRIVGYAGRGSLRGLVKVTATRAALSLLRKAGREAPGDEAILDEAGPTDPELDFLKERYRAAFRAAFADAVATLEPRERNLLRLHFLRKVTLEALASMYGVHRATIVRQLAQVRAELDRRTRAALAERLGEDRRELDSIMDLVRSRFDASVERLLRTME